MVKILSNEKPPLNGDYLIICGKISFVNTITHKQEQHHVLLLYFSILIILLQII